MLSIISAIPTSFMPFLDAHEFSRKERTQAEAHNERGDGHVHALLLIDMPSRDHFESVVDRAGDAGRIADVSEGGCLIISRRFVSKSSETQRNAMCTVSGGPPTFWRASHLIVNDDNMPPAKQEQRLHSQVASCYP